MSEANAKLQGTWRLISWEWEYQNSNERQQAMGPHPNGYLILGSNGRMMAIITAAARDPGTTDS
jgi:Lipocalin-like domain